MALPSPSAEKTLKERHDPPRCGAELNQSRYPHQLRRVKTRSPYPQYQWYIVGTRTLTVTIEGVRVRCQLAQLKFVKCRSRRTLRVRHPTCRRRCVTSALVAAVLKMFARRSF